MHAQAERFHRGFCDVHYQAVRPLLKKLPKFRPAQRNIKGIAQRTLHSALKIWIGGAELIKCGLESCDEPGALPFGGSALRIDWFRASNRKISKDQLHRIS